MGKYENKFINILKPDIWDKRQKHRWEGGDDE